MWAYAQRDGRPRNIAGALPSTADDQASWKVWLISVERLRCSNEAKTRTPVAIYWSVPNSRTDLGRLWADVRHIVSACGGHIAV